MKKATFVETFETETSLRKFVYATTGNGRVSLFAADVIAHINLIQYYYKILDGEQIDKIADSIQTQQIAYADAIESMIDYNNTNVVEHDLQGRLPCWAHY